MSKFWTLEAGEVFRFPEGSGRPGGLWQKAHRHAAVSLDHEVETEYTDIPEDAEVEAVRTHWMGRRFGELALGDRFETPEPVTCMLLEKISPRAARIICGSGGATFDPADPVLAVLAPSTVTLTLRS